MKRTPRHAPNETPRTGTRGSALVSVILVLLVLTIVGVGIAYFTSMEDRLSGNTRIAKAGFYAADAGLRRGEALLNEVINLDPAACGAQTPLDPSRGPLGAHPQGARRRLRRAGPGPLDGLERRVPRRGPPGVPQRRDPAARGRLGRGPGHVLALPPQQRG